MCLCRNIKKKKRQPKLHVRTQNALSFWAVRKRQVLMCTCMCRHNCRTSSGYLSSQLCIWPSLGNAFEALQVMLLCQLCWRRRPGEEAKHCCSLLFGRLATILTPACAVRRFASLWCPAWARLKAFQLSQQGRRNLGGMKSRSEEISSSTLWVYRHVVRERNTFQLHPSG